MKNICPRCKIKNSLMICSRGGINCFCCFKFIRMAKKDEQLDDIKEDKMKKAKSLEEEILAEYDNKIKEVSTREGQDPRTMDSFAYEIYKICDASKDFLSSAITRTVEETCDEIYKNLTDLYEDKCRHFKRSPLTSDLETSNFNNLLSGIILSQKAISQAKSNLSELKEEG